MEKSMMAILALACILGCVWMLPARAAVTPVARRIEMVGGAPAFEGSIRACATTPAWTVQDAGNPENLKVLAKSGDAGTWYGYSAKQTKQTQFLEEGALQIVVYRNEDLGTSSLVFFAAPSVKGGKLAVAASKLPKGFKVAVMDDPTDAYREVNSNKLKLNWKQMFKGEGDGAVVDLGKVDNCIMIKISKNTAVGDIAFLNSDGSAALTTKAAVGAKFKLCPLTDCPGEDAPEKPISSAAQQWVNEHNIWRDEVKVPRTSWNNEIAAAAKEWANVLKREDCRMYHSTSDFRSRTKYGYLGENLYWSQQYLPYDGEVSWDDIPKRASTGWGNEVDFYRFGPSSDSCTLLDSKEMIGHYTAMTWSTSELLGCAVATCESFDGQWYKKSAVAVCHYGAEVGCQGSMCINNLIGGFPFCARNLPKTTSGSTIPKCSGVSATAGC